MNKEEMEDRIEMLEKWQNNTQANWFGFVIFLIACGLVLAGIFVSQAMGCV